MEPHAYIQEPRKLTTWYISFQRLLRKWGRHCYSVNFSIVFLWPPFIPIHTPSTCHWSGNSSRDMTFMQLHKLVISEITFLTPKNSVLILHPPSIQHLTQPLLCCILEPLLCSSYTFRSPCCAASWGPCCAPLSGIPAVFQLIWRECRCQQNLLLTNTKNYVGRDRTKL
jgi:hypothetical protein